MAHDLSRVKKDSNNTNALEVNFESTYYFTREMNMTTNRVYFSQAKHA